MKMNQTKDWVSQWAIYSPDKIAIKEWETQRSITYLELDQKGNQLALFLQNELQLVKGNRVAILAENCLEYILLFVVAQKMGIILVPLNYRLVSAEVDYMLENAEPQLIIYENKFKEIINGTSYASKPIPQLRVEDIFDTINEVFLSNQSFYNNTLTGEDPIFILYTSGTTGFPKGAIYTHGMLFWNSITTSLSLIINSESRTVNVMPPFHTGGWNVLMTPFLHYGGYTCIVKKFEPEAVMKLLIEEAVTIFMGVPTMLKMMAELPDFEQYDFQKLNYFIVGGESMPIPLIEKWHQQGVPIRQGFGMTEVGPNLFSLHQDDAVRKKGSIGRPNFYVKTKVVNDHLEEVGVNEKGELLLQGPMMTPGYWRNKKATQKAIQDGWFHTGDLVQHDEEGYFYVVDRIKNMFISGGENVYPAEIEKVLLSHPNISEVAVIGVPDKRWGEVGKAFVVFKNQQLPAIELRQFCQSQLAKFKIPKSFVFLEEIPKNDTGKINRKELNLVG